MRPLLVRRPRSAPTCRRTSPARSLVERARVAFLGSVRTSHTVGPRRGGASARVQVDGHAERVRDGPKPADAKVGKSSVVCDDQRTETGRDARARARAPPPSRRARARVARAGRSRRAPSSDRVDEDVRSRARCARHVRRSKSGARPPARTRVVVRPARASASLMSRDDLAACPRRRSAQRRVSRRRRLVERVREVGDRRSSVAVGRGSSGSPSRLIQTDGDPSSCAGTMSWKRLCATWT